jgi:c(7)-type cytochrome triheme protein
MAPLSKAGYDAMIIIENGTGMKKKRRLISLTVTVFFLLFGQALWAQPDTVMLNSSSFSKRERTPVSFPHNRHMEGGLSCKECHHRYVQGKNVLDEAELEEGKPGIRCQECHGPKGRPDLQTAFHRQCLDCHRTNKKEGKKTGPFFCGECHVKR